MMLCQCCKKNSVEIVDDRDNPDYPYRVCVGCHELLLARSLRPLEYFNLASTHGMTFLLHDDFYDNDGSACDPEIELKPDPGLAFPELSDLHDLESIVDYAIVEWWLSDNVIAALKQFEKKEIMRALQSRVSLNRSLSGRVYQLVACTVGAYADEWIVSQWELRTDENFTEYAEALAKCLELELGFELYTKQLERVEHPAKLAETMTGLVYFQTKLSLAWIEANVSRVSNIADAWGYLAVASEFDWATAERWLQGGRPLSLIALDALANCAVTSETRNSTVWLKNNPPRLRMPKAIGEMNQLLLQYGESDKVPRVRSKIDFIVKHWDKILKL